MRADIPQRLHIAVEHYGIEIHLGALLLEAADALEATQSELARIEKKLDGIISKAEHALREIKERQPSL